jgi:hypothetical protein
MDTQTVTEAEILSDILEAVQTIAADIHTLTALATTLAMRMFPSSATPMDQHHLLQAEQVVEHFDGSTIAG